MIPTSQLDFSAKNDTLHTFPQSNQPHFSPIAPLPLIPPQGPTFAPVAYPSYTPAPSLLSQASLPSLPSLAPAPSLEPVASPHRNSTSPSETLAFLQPMKFFPSLFPTLTPSSHKPLQNCINPLPHPLPPPLHIQPLRLLPPFPSLLLNFHLAKQPIWQIMRRRRQTLISRPPFKPLHPNQSPRLSFLLKRFPLSSSRPTRRS